MRSRSFFGLAAACVLLPACDGLKEALTAHVDVVSRVGPQELSVTRLANLIGNAKIQIPVTRDNAAVVADIWSGYQQLALAAAHNDSLNDKKVLDASLAPIFNNMRLQKFMEQVTKTFKVDSANESAYNQAGGGLLAARHILIGFPPAATQTQKDSVKKRADEIRAQVTNANFTDMAKKYSTDPGVAQNNGNYGVFAHGDMVPEFENGTKALKPGEISPPVMSQFGYHIIQRLPYAEVKDQFAQRYSSAAMANASEAFIAKLDTAAGIDVKATAPAAVRNAFKDVSKARKDKSTLATFKGGDLTLSEFMDWVQTFPPQQAQMFRRQIPTAPDSALKPFVKGIAEREVMLQKADSAKVEIPATDRTALYGDFQNLVTQVWQQLGIDPKQLADSAKSTAERERVAAARVEAYLDRILGGQAQAAPVPDPLKKVLDAKYEASVNAAGIDRAVTQAQRLRAVADSTRAANQPRSQVPIPGIPPAGPPPTATQPPASQPPATQPPAPTKKP